jgi:ArsR family transcriptional regulator
MLAVHGDKEGPDMWKNVIAVARALSDPTRLRIIKLLTMGELCVCQIEYLLAASQSRVSQNLAILKHADLVTDRRDGKWVYYMLNQPAVEQAMADLRAIFSEANLEGIPEMADELERWRQMPADLGVCTPVEGPHVGGADMQGIVTLDAAVDRPS